METAAVFADYTGLLTVAESALGIGTRDDLQRWVRGKLQVFAPHQALLVAWGDFVTGAVDFEVIAGDLDDAMACTRNNGTRAASRQPQATEAMPVCDLVSFAIELRGCQTSGRLAPRSFQGLEGCRTPDFGCRNCASARSLPWAGSGHGLVYGFNDLRAGVECIYVFLGMERPLDDQQQRNLAFLMPFLDTCVRQAVPMGSRCCLEKGGGTARHGDDGRNRDVLSERESQVMDWVRIGKTNHEIGRILNISALTAKSHVRRILKKLDVTSRAQAVDKVHRLARVQRGS